MIEALFVMFGIGITCGSVLSIASKIFYVYEDPRIAKVENCLAGANCGGCGYAGCSAAAVAVVEGNAPTSVCIISPPEASAQVAAVMGLEAGTSEPLKSINECLGGHRAENQFDYMGVNSCRAIAAIYGGKRLCSIGCLGMGDCVKSCAFDAIHMGTSGFPVVDQDKCVGCGACKKVCPKNILSIKTMSERLLDFNQFYTPVAPCKQECPAEIDIPAYISHIRSGNYKGAVDTIRERNPLLLSCGRVCPHPCENYCRRGIEDEPVSINQLKRFAADFEMTSGTRFPIKCAPPTDKRVAVIGGGPAGLSCAYFLRRLGHSVTIFEAMPKLGGIIRYGIPEYRLPKKVLDWEIEGILNLGIKSHTQVRLGKDFDMGSLISAGFDAVFLGIGAWDDYNLGIKGEDLKGCYKGIDFLSKVALGIPPKIGRKAAVVGGGNSAIDCVRTLIRLGADEVYIVYRRTRTEMPANEMEIVAAEHEGVKFKFLAAPVSVVGDDEGNVTHLEYLTMELGEPDASGRRRPVPVEGSESLLEVDMLITAIGQQPDVTFKEDGKRLKDLNITKWNTIDNIPETLQTGIPYVFTAGDSATGASLVVEAIGGGRRAARSIHQYLTGKEIKPVTDSLYKQHIPESIFNSVHGIRKTPRVKMPELPVNERIGSMIESDLVITESEAICESKRCLSCCITCYNKDVA
jgi:formate dehydrogenase beta subunit